MTCDQYDVAQGRELDGKAPGRDDANAITPLLVAGGSVAPLANTLSPIRTASTLVTSSTQRSEEVPEVPEGS